MNTDRTRDAVKRLNETFRRYVDVELAPAKSCIEDHSVLESVRSSLLSTPFEDLTARDLLDYYYLAVEHLGTANDLRHFLPKMLALLTDRDGSLLAAEHLEPLLASAGAQEWPVEEREALSEFARAAAADEVIPPRVAKKLLGLLGFTGRVAPSKSNEALPQTDEM